jgi:hypothetical protein
MFCLPVGGGRQSLPHHIYYLRWWGHVTTLMRSSPQYAEPSTFSVGRVVGVSVSGMRRQRDKNHTAHSVSGYHDSSNSATSQAHKRERLDAEACMDHNADPALPRNVMNSAVNR